jgi:TolB-like protein/Tfp pilus assembly protein PilF
MAISTTFGPFVFERSSGTLTRDGRPVQLGGRAAALLGALAAAEGPVSKDVLIEAAWPGTIVEEGNLSVQIAGLRKVLGPAPDGGEWIATVPRVGYRLTRLAQAAPAPTTADAMPALAVLPFANLGGDVQEDYFGDGIVEEIITALSRFRSFAVISRNSTFVYKGRAVDVREVSRDLGASYVLEGSVRRAGTRLRIGAQLVDGANGAHLWAQAFEGTIEDVFDVQDRITEGVVAIIEPQIQQAEMERSRRKRPDSLDAYDLYLRSRPFHYGGLPIQNAEGIALLERAVAISPDYAQALAMLSDSLQHRIGMGWPELTPNDRERCLEFAYRALDNALNDATVLAHGAMALITVARDYERGVLTAQRALEANPNSVIVGVIVGIVYLHCGKLEDTLTILQRALRLSPGDPAAFLPLTGIAHAHMALGNYHEALSWADRSLALNRHFDPSLWILTAGNALLGRMDLARGFLSQLMQMAPEITVSGIRNGQPAKDPERMRAILEGLSLAGLPPG